MTFTFHFLQSVTLSKHEGNYCDCGGISIAFTVPYGKFEISKLPAWKRVQRLLIIHSSHTSGWNLHRDGLESKLCKARLSCTPLDFAKIDSFNHCSSVQVKQVALQGQRWQFHWIYRILLLCQVQFNKPHLFLDNQSETTAAMLQAGRFQAFHLQCRKEVQQKLVRHIRLQIRVEIQTLQAQLVASQDYHLGDAHLLQLQVCDPS